MSRVKGMTPRIASNTGDRTLTYEQLHAAIAMLGDERAAHPVSARQRRLFRWFQWAVWFFLAGFMLFFLLLLLVPTKEEEFSVTAMVALMLVLLAFGPSLLALLAAFVLLALNAKLFVQTVREMAIVIRSRLWRLTSRGVRRPAWLRRLLWVPKASGLFVAAGVLSGLAMGLWELSRESLFSALLSLAIVVVIAAHFFLRFARRRLALLDDADRLATSLASLQPGSATVVVADAVFRKVAQIEDGQIERKRAEALAGPEQRATDYALLRSRRLVQQLQEFEPMERLRIERSIASLADTEASSDAPVGIETVAVPQTGCVLRVRRDAATRRIEVLELSAEGGSEEVARA